MLDHDDRVAAVDQAVQQVQQLGDVVEVQAGRRLVEDVERPAGGALGQLPGELHALRFAAGERRRRLAELDVAEADLVERAAGCWRSSGCCGTVSSPCSTVMSRISAMICPLYVHLQRLAVVALAAADVAGDVDVGQEVHLDLDLPVALARLAAAALHVEAEPSRPVAAHARLGRLRHQVADLGRRRCVYVAGFERGVRPMGDWSMSITLSICSRPVDALVLAGRVRRAS